MAEDLYRTVIKVPINGIDQYFYLDLCTQRSVQSEATIASYPVQGGVTVSDHMFRNPRTMSISGAFSLNSSAVSLGYDTYVNLKDRLTNQALTEKQQELMKASWEDWFNGEGADLKNFGSNDRLQAIQNLFEWVQAKGILCDVMMSQANGEHPRFTIRKNMALRSISWVEKFNSMEFTLGFYEVIQISQLFGEFEWFQYDERYPSPMEPSARSLGEVIQNSGDLVQAVMNALLNQGYIAKADAKSFTLKNAGLATTGKIVGAAMVGALATNFLIAIVAAVSYIMGWGVGAGAAAAAAAATAAATAAGTTAATSIATSATVTLSATGIGLIVVAAAAIAIGVGCLIAKAVDSKKKRDRLKKGFNLILNYKQYVDAKTLEPTGKEFTKAKHNETDLARLQQLLNYISDQVTKTMGNVTVYQITDKESDNEVRAFPLPVGSDMLYATITKNNGSTDGIPFELTLYDGLGEDAKVVTGQMGRWPVCTNLEAMSRNSTVVHVTKDLQYECYLFNPSADAAINPKSEAYQTAISKLSNYYFLVCNGRMEENAKKLSKTIVDAIDDYMKPVK